MLRTAGPTLAIALTVIPAGCTGDLPDPPGKAPTLAGSWTSPTPPSDSGCWIIDESGKFTALRDPGAAQASLGVSEILLDGIWRPFNVDSISQGATDDFSVEYATVGEATLLDSNVRIQFTMSVRAFGLVFASATSTIEGTYDGDRIAGISTTTFVSHVPGFPSPPEPEVTEIELIRGDCSAPPPCPPNCSHVDPLPQP